MAKQTIKPNDFSKAINKILEQYGDEVRVTIEDIITDAAKEATSELRKKSTGEFKDVTGKYRKSWTKKITKSNVSVEAVVYSRDQYRLTHLLEFGHALKRGGRTIGKGKVQAFPHISDVNEMVINKVETELKKKL